MRRFEEIIIFGCGGVGSWIGEYLVRQKMTKLLSLVDFDTIEEKNMERQNFTRLRLGDYKTTALRRRVDALQNTNDDTSTDVLTYNRRVRDTIDLQGLNKDAIAIIATDNIMSKRFIAENFRRRLIVNCDKNFVEIKNFLDESDLKAWDMGGGYSNAQDIDSNIYASIKVIGLLKYYGLTLFDRKNRIVVKVDSELRKFDRV